MSEQKTYVNAAFFDEKVFDDGGSIIKVTIKDTDEFIKFLKEKRNNDKSMRLVISKKKNVEEGKSSHYAYIDTFVPRSQQKPQAASKPVVKSTPKKAVAVAEDDDDQLV